MYHVHFGLQQSPFGITPNPAFFYSGNMRGEILDALLYAVINGEGIIKVSGEVGSGKTMLCRMLENRLPPHIEVIYLANPSLSRHEVLYAIAGELELDIAGRRVDEVLRLLHADLIAKHVAGRQVLLLVEEAQAMPLETLEEIRLFSNLETARHKLLQIVLFGQPELDVSLNLPGMRQLKERITHSFVMPPMALAVVPEFLAFRMRAAGYDGPAVFSADAVRLMAKVSRGIIRRINILADKALLAAFADDAPSVQARHVRAAIQDSTFGRAPMFDARSWAFAAALLTLLALGAWFIVHPPLAAGSMVAPSQTSLLLQTSAATRAWLREQALDQLSLQIASLPQTQTREIEQMLKSLRDAVGAQQVHAYPAKVGGADHVALAVGSFASRAQAEAMAALLSERWGLHAQIVDIKTIRARIEASGPAERW